MELGFATQISDHPVWIWEPIPFDILTKERLVSWFSKRLTIELSWIDAKGSKNDDKYFDCMTEQFDQFRAINVEKLLPIEQTLLALYTQFVENWLKLPVDEFSLAEKEKHQEIFHIHQQLRILQSLVVLQALLDNNKYLPDMEIGLDIDDIPDVCVFMEDDFIRENGDIDWVGYIEDIKKSGSLPFFANLLQQVQSILKVSDEAFTQKICENIHELVDYFCDETTESRAALIWSIWFFSLTEEQLEYIVSEIMPESSDTEDEEYDEWEEDN